MFSYIFTNIMQLYAKCPLSVTGTFFPNPLAHECVRTYFWKCLTCHCEVSYYITVCCVSAAMFDACVGSLCSLLQKLRYRYQHTLLVGWTDNTVVPID